MRLVFQFIRILGNALLTRAKIEIYSNVDKFEMQTRMNTGLAKVKVCGSIF